MMVRWYEPVSTQGQDLLGGHGGADRGQGGRRAPDRGAPGLSPSQDRAGGPAGGRAAEDRRLAGPGAAGPGVPGPSSGTNRPGLHHGGVQALGPAVGRCARGLHPSGTEGRHWG